MLWKNLPDDELQHVMRIRCFLDYLAAFQTLLFNHNWGDFKAIISARRAFKRWRNEFKRPDNKSNMAENSSDTLSNCAPDGRRMYSILWQYYVHGNKHFDRLPGE